ncbi:MULTISPECIES: hypothetical protein [unclassified Nocardioides]|uniref:hypothetical protein n=1 Tax=unclassified Nocardioides TaxID=2615069 RepID=UPI0007032F19|nr:MULTISPECIES: hypothetical protein [unclassified Nocardioides]KRC53323.1 hypothetical protein ASE19_13290 [Nocardioides sp. Root79]KRC70660.1 hypothetical protein ASE20_12135 [Nocardioides sp. Root240]
MPARQARILFRTAALFNAAAVLLFLPALGLAEDLGLRPVPTDTVFSHIGIAAIGLFGVGYWMAGGSPDRNRGIVQLGLAGKVLVVAIVAGHLVDGTANGRLTAVVSGDVVFSLLFAWYLVATRVPAPARPPSG